MSSPMSSSQTSAVPAVEKPAKPEKRQCRHILSDGLQCRRLATLGQATCFYHKADTQGRNTVLDAACGHAFGPNAPLPLDIPLLDNQAAVTLTLTQVMRLMAAGILDDRRGGKLLYALNIAQRGLAQ